VYLVDRSGKIMFWNAGAERITGYLPQDIVGHSSLEDVLGTWTAKTMPSPRTRFRFLASCAKARPVMHCFSET